MGLLSQIGLTFFDSPRVRTDDPPFARTGGARFSVPVAATRLATLSVAPTSISEGNSGTKTATVTVKLSAGEHDRGDGDLHHCRWHEKAGSDNQGSTGSLTFAPDGTSRTICVKPFGDKPRRATRRTRRWAQVGLGPFFDRDVARLTP